MARERATDTDTLVLAAAKTFRAKGYRKATIDDIAEAAGISRPTVYKYVRNKQQLLDLMVDTVTASMEAHQRELLESDEPAPVRLQRFVDGHIEETTEHREFYAIVFSEEVELSARSLRKFRTWAHRRTAEFRDLLDECLALQAEPPAVDTAVAANLILSMLASLYRWYDPAGSVSPAVLSKQIGFLLEGFVPGTD